MGFLEKELIGHNKEIEEQLFKKYAELRREKALCKGCNVPREVNNGLPVSFFVVGSEFQNQKFKVLFVGKTVQDGWESEPVNETSGFIDSRKYAKQGLFLPLWSTYPFWHCIKEICQILWNTSDLEAIWRRIAITNLVKCSTATSLDTTPEPLKRNCIQISRFFENEVKIIQPSHMILFTGSDYDKYLENLTFGYEKKNERTSREHYEDDVRWWHREILDAGNVKMHFLRTCHPGFFKIKSEDRKWDFCHGIAEWIRQNTT